MDVISPFQSDLEREGVRDLLILQYALHEAGHHSGTGRPISPDARVVPKAHTVSDIYKCLHQGIFGVGHSIRNPEDFGHRLAQELDRARPTAGEPLTENVSPDGSMLRINLHPFRSLFMGDEEKGGELLVKVCLESAAMNTGSPERFFADLEFFRVFNNTGQLEVDGRIFSFPQHTVESFLYEIGKLISASGRIPVLSHSSTYRDLNDPSYRVVHRSVLMRSPLAFLMSASI